MATRIQVRRDTSTAWAAANPVLRAGEWGLETDTAKTKIGNGSAAWTALAYSTADRASLVGATFTGDVSIDKAAPKLTLTGTGDAVVVVEGVVTKQSVIQLRTGTSDRWHVGRDGTAEGGANAGSDFVLTRFSDTAAWLGAAVTVARATGKTTLGAAGAAAGLELGASGPRVMAGTGSPEGVVTAPVGSTWLDTDATTGAIRWVKAAGTGNTGWVVEYGDTGWRDVRAELPADATTNILTWDSARLRRIGSQIFYTMRASVGAASPLVGTTSGVAALCAVPAGFRPADYVSVGSASYGYGAEKVGLTFQNSLTDLGMTPRVSGNWGDVPLSTETTWITANAWPTSLPGSAI